MKKKILTILSVFSIVASLTACNSATEAVKEPETAKNWEVSTYYMNGYYNPETKELTTVDAAGNCDIWDNIEILDLYKDADYWKDIDENNEVFVWAKISTNGTKSINDDEAV